MRRAKELDGPLGIHGLSCTLKLGAGLETETCVVEIGFCGYENMSSNADQDIYHWYYTGPLRIFKRA